MVCILVLDDDRHTHAFVRQVLEADGHEVCTAADAAAAHHCRATMRPALVLLALHLLRAGEHALHAGIRTALQGIPTIFRSQAQAGTLPDDVPTSSTIGWLEMSMHPERVRRLVARLTG
jgi:DNA-binding response OmpR family regulator